MSARWSAAGLAAVGRTVVGLESDPNKLACLRAGKAPFYEADLDNLIVTGFHRETLSFTDDSERALGSSDVVFLCVGTPQGERPAGCAGSGTRGSRCEQLSPVVQPP